MTCNNKQVELLMKYKKQNPKMTLKLLALRSGMDVKTARKYIKNDSLPSECKKPRSHRTRKDPFAEHGEFIDNILNNTKGLQAKTLLYHLMEQFPGVYNESNLRSLQRRVREINCLNENSGKDVIFPQNIQPGCMSQSDWVILDDLNITIAGSFYSHRLYHFMLPYSRWEDIMICYTESFETLSSGYIKAVTKLGGTLKEHRTDNLSAATKKSGGRRAFTDRWQSFMDHYNVTPSRNNPGMSNENGSVEKSHDLLKNAINQALILRGNRNFPNIESYKAFLDKIIAARNNSRQEALEEEISYLQTLPKRSWNDPKILMVRVSPSSTVSILGVIYSVPYRLISYHLKVYAYSEVIELYLGTKLLLTLERSNGQEVIDYRHIIDSLVRKPGAFAKYKYHNHLFPGKIFRIAFDKLSSHHSNGHKHYLKILQMAKSYGESEVAAALELCIESNIDLKKIEDLLRNKQSTPKYESYVLDPDLSEYDKLLSDEFNMMAADKSIKTQDEQEEQRCANSRVQIPAQNPEIAQIQPQKIRDFYHHHDDDRIENLEKAERMRSVA